jgi:hypothetical protein
MSHIDVIEHAWQHTSQVGVLTPQVGVVYCTPPLTLLVVLLPTAFSRLRTWEELLPRKVSGSAAAASAAATASQGQQAGGNGRDKPSQWTGRMWCNHLLQSFPWGMSPQNKVDFQE